MTAGFLRKNYLLVPAAPGLCGVVAAAGNCTDLAGIKA